MTKFNARQFAKFGFVRDESQDFSDDGARFRCWTYNGVRVSYTTFNGEAFISPSFKVYNKSFTYNDFYNAMKELGLEPDCYNGIENDKELIDLGYLAEQIDAVLELIDELEEKFSKPEPIAYAANERLVNEKQWVKDAIEAITKVDWLEYDEDVVIRGYHKVTVNDLRKWYRYLQGDFKKLEAIDKSDAHKVNETFYRHGYVVVRREHKYSTIAEVEQFMASYKA